MEERKENDCLKLPEGFPLQQRAIHEIVKKHWCDLLMTHTECIFLLRETENWFVHRKNVFDNLSEILKQLPKKLKCKLINAVFCFQKGYSEAAIWKEKCNSAVYFNIFKIAEAGDYYIEEFIDPSGHFMELKWATRFVDDENQNMERRFVMTCFYGFEDKIEKLWSTMKQSEQHLCGGSLEEIKTKYPHDRLVVMWVYQLENKFDALQEASFDLYGNGFTSGGFMEAISKGHEYAARFFWEKMSESEKNNFLQNPEFGLLSDAAEDNHPGVVYFIYSLLKKEQKKKLIEYTVNDGVHRLSTSSAPILCCLLQSQYYPDALNDILDRRFFIPTQIYKWILISLSFEIAELQISIHKSIFKAVWECLLPKEREKVLQGKCYIIKNLVDIREMGLLKMIIQPLSHSEKDGILLTDFDKGGVTALDDFSCQGHYDKLERYLLYFLIDYCLEKNELAVRSDASSFFDKFIMSENFIEWSRNIPAPESKEVNKVIQKLQDNLKVPCKLLKLIEN